jgi:hypothetical protein
VLGFGVGVRVLRYSSLQVYASAKRRLWSLFLDTLRFYERPVRICNGHEWFAHFRFLAPSLAAQPFGCLVLLDAGPY